MTTPANNARTTGTFSEYYGTDLVDELADTASLWYKLKLAEMSGYDYVFATRRRCRELCSLAALEAFMQNLQTIIGNHSGRTILIAYWRDPGAELHFEKYHLDWADGFAIRWYKESLDNSPQREFVELLFAHSEKLLPGKPSRAPAPPA